MKVCTRTGNCARFTDVEPKPLPTGPVATCRVARAERPRVPQLLRAAVNGSYTARSRVNTATVFSTDTRSPGVTSIRTPDSHSPVRDCGLGGRGRRWQR
jgi:hypothetical protein